MITNRIHVTTAEPPGFLKFGAKWDVKTMKNSIGIEKNVLTRLARPASLAAPAAAGSGSPPAATASAEAMLIFWFGQMTIHTLAAIVMPSSAPKVMLRPGDVSGW